MSTITNAADKERVGRQSGQKVQAGPSVETRLGKSARDDQHMPQQLESPLYATINQRSPIRVDETPAQQLESPLYALVNQRERASLAQLEARQVEYPLNAQINQREPKPFAQLPAQKESPLNALINGHTAPRTWRAAKA